MKYNPEIHDRRSMRLRGYDYSQEGAYFITICCRAQKCFFGEIKNEEMLPNEIGKIAHENLREIPIHFPHVEMGSFVVMPNHVHCILILGAHHDDDEESRQEVAVPKTNRFGKPISGSVSVIINHYKSSVKKWCNRNGRQFFSWQSRFHDHIIRSEQTYDIISEYILNNPLNWNSDKFIM